MHSFPLHLLFLFFPPCTNFLSLSLIVLRLLLSIGISILSNLLLLPSLSFHPILSPTSRKSSLLKCIFSPCLSPSIALIFPLLSYSHPRLPHSPVPPPSPSPSSERSSSSPFMTSIFMFPPSMALSFSFSSCSSRMSFSVGSSFTVAVVLICFALSAGGGAYV